MLIMRKKKKSKYCLEMTWDNAFSRWRLQKEQNAYGRCTTHQKLTEYQATCTVSIPFNKKELFIFNTAYRMTELPRPSDNYEILSLQMQQLTTKQQESWLYSIGGRCRFFFCTLYLHRKKATWSDSFGSSFFTLFICIFLINVQS